MPIDPAPTGAPAGLDLILDTVSAPHDIEPYLKLLAPNGRLVLLGLTSEPFKLSSSNLVFSQKVIQGSLIGGTVYDSPVTITPRRLVCFETLATIS